MELSDPSDWYWNTSYHRGLRASIKRLEDFYKEQEDKQKDNKPAKSSPKKTNKTSGASFKSSRGARKTFR